MLLQLLGVFLLPFQETESLQQRGLQPQGKRAVSREMAPWFPGWSQKPAGPSPPRAPPAGRNLCHLLVWVAVCALPGQGAAHAGQATAQQQQQAKHAL